MLFVPHHIDEQLNRIKYNLFSDTFLENPDELEYTAEPFPTNGDRCMAVELFKRLDPFFYPKYVSPSFLLCFSLRLTQQVWFLTAANCRWLALQIRGSNCSTSCRNWSSTNSGHTRHQRSHGLVSSWTGTSEGYGWRGLGCHCEVHRRSRTRHTH